MSETLRDLVVSLSLQSDNFTRNIRSVNKQIQEAESRFKLAAAGVEGFERTATGLTAQLSTLERRLSLQKDVVTQYQRALDAADNKLLECVERQSEYARRLEDAKKVQQALKEQVGAAAKQVRTFSSTLGDSNSATIAAKANLDALKVEYRASVQEVKKLSGQNTALKKSTQNAADAVSQANTQYNNARAAVRTTEAEIVKCNQALRLAETYWDEAGESIEASRQAIATFGKQIGLAESRFKLATAGIRDMDTSAEGLSAKLTLLREKLDIFLGDSVRVIARRIGVEVSMRMTQYTYDCLTRQYTSVTLGTVADTPEGNMISIRQLAAGSITGAKLAINSVGAGQLQSGAVGSLQIKNAAIGSAHIQNASITRAHIAEALIDVLNVNALTAVTAKIKELAAGSITADELYTSIAMIATAQLTTANIVNAQIDWAQIENLAAEIASISKAQITTATINEANIDWAAISTLSAAVASIVKADIGTADIDWAHIKDLATDTAIITQGVGGELYIARLAVTEANLVSLTVGELVVKGTDGHFYSVSVDGSGNVVSTLKQVANDDVVDLSINAGEKIIEGSVTAACLNVQDIFADNAIIRSLIAANIDVDTLFAREATIHALNAMDITGNEYLRLMVGGKADQTAVDDLNKRMSQAELKITEDAIVSTVTSSTTYRDAQQKIYDDMDSLLGYRLEVRAATVFLTENVRSTTLTAHVWHGNTEVTDALPAERFFWTRESEDATADSLWNASHKGYKSILVSTADVLRQASFRCELTE